MSHKIYSGAQIRHLRERRGMRQADLARALSISPSYVNQLERNRRPVTVPVLLRLTEVFGVGAEAFAEADTARLVGELREAFADGTVREAPTAGELEDLAGSHPAIARALLDLHRDYRRAVDRIDAAGLAHRGADGGAGEEDGGPGADGAGVGGSGSGPRAAAVRAARGFAQPPQPHEAVRDVFHAHQNHFPAVDEAAERLSSELGVRPGEARPALLRHLRDAHGVRTVLHAPERALRDNRHFDPRNRILTLGSHLRSGQQAFQLATQLALLEAADTIEAVVDEVDPGDGETRRLLRIGLASYFAGALLLPYRAFHAAAEEQRYDVELLAVTFGVGFEVVSHRLSTLQRRGLRGVPFSFVRVDRAGNVSKRQSATGFHFSRFGGTCPLWVLYDAFETPGSIRTQVAEMPDGREYLWIARTTRRGHAGFGRPSKTFALGLGCEMHHAHRLVYGDGHVVAAAPTATPIGMGCKACDREGCPQRAFPPLGRRLEIDEDHTPFDPYRVRAGGGA